MLAVTYNVCKNIKKLFISFIRGIHHFLFFQSFKAVFAHLRHYCLYSVPYCTFCLTWFSVLFKAFKCVL